MAAEPNKAKGSLAHDGAEEFSPPMIHLTHAHLKKFGIKEMPKVGSKVKISGLVHVGSVSEHDGSHDLPTGGGEGPKGGKRQSMSLHLHEMEMGQDGQSTKDVEREADTQKGMKSAIDEALKRGAGGAKGKNSEGAGSGGKPKAAGGKEGSKTSGG